MLTPEYYTKYEGDDWHRWPSHCRLTFELLAQRSKYFIKIDELCVHSIAFDDPALGPGRFLRWDCISGFNQEYILTSHEDCVYKNAVLWWKAEALLCSIGKGEEIGRLLVAVIIPIPIPNDVAMSHMEKAKEAIKLLDIEINKKG